MTTFRQPSVAAISRARASLESSRVPNTHAATPLLAETWQAIGALCADLTDAQWRTPTDCPGWSVMDQVAHIIGTERTLLGHPLPRDPVVANHVKNELGAFNEAWVEHYRGWQGHELLMEFSRLTQERLEVMANLSPAQLEADTLSPIGIVPLGEFLAIRLVDSFIHEQDIRRALDRPGRLDSAAAAFVVDRSVKAMPKVVARGAQAPEGTVVVFTVEGDAGMESAIGVFDDRGRVMDAVPAERTVHIDLDVDAFLRLCTGRLTGETAVNDALVGIDGDITFGKKLLGVMNFML